MTNPQPLTSEEIAALEEMEKKATKGPWSWNLSLKSKRIMLESATRGYETVMDFTRWGMNGARPRFRRSLDSDGKCAIMIEGEEFAAIVPGREHHAGWFQTLDHPDANLIAALRNAFPRLIATIRALEADVSRLDGILKGDPTLISAEFGIGAPNEIKLGHPIASVIINTFYEMLKQSGGENFVTLNGYPKDPADGSRGEPIEVTIRYHNGKTPAEKLTELRAELAEVTAERDALRAKCEGMEGKGND